MVTNYNITIGNNYCKHQIRPALYEDHNELFIKACSSLLNQYSIQTIPLEPVTFKVNILSSKIVYLFL